MGLNQRVLEKGHFNDYHWKFVDENVVDDQINFFLIRNALKSLGDPENYFSCGQYTQYIKYYKAPSVVKHLEQHTVNNGLSFNMIADFVKKF